MPELLKENCMLENQKVVRENNRVVVRGIFQRADTPNKNNRVYTRGLWESILKRNDVTESLSNKQMLGELDHPDVTETSLKNVSHVVTKLELTDKNEVIGEAEILDTPNGLILQKLLEAGVKVGISSRGYVTDDSKGKTNEKGQYMVPESFVLKTFDFVVDPSTPGAFPSQVSESVKSEIMSLVESAGPRVSANIKAICESLNTVSKKGEDDDMERIKQLEAELAKRDQTIAQLEGSFQKTFVENAQLKADIELLRKGEPNEAAAQLQEELDKAKGLVSDLTKAVEEGKGREDAATEIIAEMRDRILTAESILEQVLEASEEKLGLAVEVIENLRDRYLTAESMIQSLQEKEQEQAQELDMVNAKVVSFENKAALEGFVVEKAKALNMSEEAVRNAIKGANTLDEAKDKLLNVKSYIEKHSRTLPIGPKVNEGNNGAASGDKPKPTSKLASAIARMH